MKCAYYLRQKRSKLSKEDKKKLDNIVSDFMAKSIVMGPEKALETIKEEKGGTVSVQH